jgi:hypothetical protein
MILISRPARSFNSRGISPFGHTLCFSKAPVVHSCPGDVIKRGTLIGLSGSKKKPHRSLQVFPSHFRSEDVRLSFPPMSASVPAGALIGWMVLLTVKHVIADFVLQTSWMAIGKDQRTGWFLPLLAHCGVHFAVAMALILVVAPRFWFVAVIDFAIHITVDRGKGLVASRLGVTQENHHPWFWTLIGVDQALHHLTDFGLSIFIAANG